MSNRISIRFTHGLQQEVAVLMNSSDAAHIYNKLSFWMEGNEVSGQYLHDDGRTYVKVPAAKLADKLPWMNERTVSRWLNKMVEAGLLGKPCDEDGNVVNLSENKYDKTSYFTVLPYCHTEKTDCDLPLDNMSDGCAQSGESYKDNTLPNASPNALIHTARGPFLRAIQVRWNNMAAIYELNGLDLMTPERMRWIERRLEDVGGDESLLMRAIDNVPHDPHRIGMTPAKWRVDFDWIFKDRQRFAKCLESKPLSQEIQNAKPSYQNKSRSQQNGEQRSAEIDAAFRLALSQPQQR